MRQTRSCTIKRLQSIAKDKLEGFGHLSVENVNTKLDSKEKKVDWLVYKSISTECDEFTCLKPIRSFEDVEVVQRTLLRFDERVLVEHIRLDLGTGGC